MGQEGSSERSACLAAIIIGILLTVAAVVSILVILTGRGGTHIPAAVPILLGTFGIGLWSWGFREWGRLGHVTVAKKTRTADNEVRLYQDTDSRSPMVARLAEGTAIDLGETKTVNGLPWIRVRLPDGREGYILGNSHIYTVLKAIIVDAQAFVYRSRAPEGPPLARLAAGSEIEIVETEWDSVTGSPGAVVTVLLSNGQRGYLLRSTKVKWV